ncbi:hypothetical protein V6N11_036381 [Hibiscus sabdariffa]|uniref:RNase H type-1 domain-containing protein n=1 Tax=Hibiscus sabdariffa TaxID=183260 RepID=A0ABR2RA98_9ROSI
MIDSFKWQVSLCNWLCLNIDVAVSSPKRSGIIGGVFQESSYEWINGYCKSIGIVSPLQAELWSIIVGLQLAWSMGTSSLYLVCAIALLYNRNWSIDFAWVPCELNMVADGLSKLPPLPRYHLMIFDVVLEAIQPLLVSDRDSPTYRRRRRAASFSSKVLS